MHAYSDSVHCTSIQLPSVSMGNGQYHVLAIFNRHCFFLFFYKLETHSLLAVLRRRKFSKWIELKQKFSHSSTAPVRCLFDTFIDFFSRELFSSLSGAYSSPSWKIEVTEWIQMLLPVSIENQSHSSIKLWWLSQSFLGRFWDVGRPFWDVRWMCALSRLNDEIF